MPKKVRPIRVEEDVAHVPLTQGYEAIIDAEDVHLVEGYNWCVKKDTCRITQYALANFKSQRSYTLVRMHRVLMGVNDSKVHVDHINGNGLDNRKINLRLATNQENLFNSRKPRNNSSGYKGVSWSKSMNKWMASIQMSKRLYLGAFDCPKEAYEAYCKAAKELHGDFHNLG
jgi:hypothetical protein